jgi:hypothetical protein
VSSILLTLITLTYFSISKGILSINKAELASSIMEPFSYQSIDEEFPENHDERVLLSLGYKQEFKREFSLWSSFCVSFAVLGLLPSFASTMYYGMGTAGTAGMRILLFSFTQ